MSFDFALPQNWRWETIDTLKASGRSIVSGPFGSNIGKRFFVGEGIPVIRGNNLSLGMGRFNDDGFVFLTEEKATEFRNCEAHPNDLLFTAAGTIGQVGIIPPRPRHSKYIISNKQLRARLDQARIQPLFAYYWLASPPMVAMIQNRNTGSTIPLINLSVLKSLPIPVPPLEVQDAIVNVLSVLDDRITLLRETNATLEAIAQALFKSWFVDFDPVHAKQQGLAPEGMDEATAALFPDSFEESELGLVPWGWQLMQFGQLLSHTVGGDWGDEEPNEQNDIKVAIIRGTDIPDLQSGTNHRVPIRYTSAKKLLNRKLEHGDIVIEVSGGSKGQPTGRSIYLTAEILKQFDCAVEPASFCRLLRPASGDLGILLGQHLTYIYAKGKTWEYQNQSTGIANFQTTHFLETELVAVPSAEVLNEFANIVRPLIDRTHLSQMRQLAGLRDTLLPRLISGQLRLPEAEATIEEVH